MIFRCSSAVGTVTSTGRKRSIDTAGVRRTFSLTVRSAQRLLERAVRCRERLADACGNTNCVFRLSASNVPLRCFSYSIGVLRERQSLSPYVIHVNKDVSSSSYHLTHSELHENNTSLSVPFLSEPNTLAFTSRLSSVIRPRSWILMRHCALALSSTRSIRPSAG